MSKEKSEQKSVSVPKIVWDDSKLKTTYANVCNVSSTREEVHLLLGTNQSWNAGQKEVKVELNDRIILSPFAAKRLLVLLSNVVGQYEKRFGALDLETGQVPPPAEKN